MQRAIGAFNSIIDKIAELSNRVQRLENAILLANRFSPIQETTSGGENG